MSRQFAFPVFGAVAALLSFSAIPSSSHAAETCIAAPTQPAPQGSHWYYRLERATQRKCWRLVKLDQQPQSAAKQVAPQGEPADEADAAPAAATSAGRVQSPQHGWLTRSASAVPETAAPTQGTPDRASEPADDQAAASPPVSAAPPPVSAPQEQAIEAAAPVAPVQAAEPKQTTMAAQIPAAAAAGTGMTQFVFLAIAGIGLFAAAIFFIVDLRRRRTDVLTRIARQDITSFEAPEAEDAPTFSAMPPMRLMPRHDDVDEALQRSRRRRMAA
jgi:hypothetical protein